MAIYRVVPDIWSVGAVDWDIRSFHGPSYSTHRGTTYNAYIIKDDKTALVDTVHLPFAAELIANLKQIDGLTAIDYVIVNHIEPDHSGALPEIMNIYPQATVVCTAKAREGLVRYFDTDGWTWKIVKTGDSLELGHHTLRFIETPMMHWPDNMITYIPQKQLLLSNDAFGQHLAWSHPFDDQNPMEDIMAEAQKYYANILTPFSKIVANKLKDILAMNLDIKIIAPSHGIIWRSHPEKILEAYSRWANAEADPKALVVYDTMWGSTEKMTRAILEGIARAGVSAVLFKASASDSNDIMAQLLEAKAIVVGSSTINNDMLVPVAAFLEEVKGLKPAGKLGAAFGSYGWRGGAVESIEKQLAEGKVELALDSLKVQWAPDEEFLGKCRDWGFALGTKIKG
ncbi:MAG: FprA family A-type flavoprotein [Bacillota bacterium]|jgi:anaerobic nitric oxide reductase flavorubredoxin|nr:MBL fold metallo-hydrolase [Bacillota bacterium]HOC06699.1 MBL fold metallo-hydrolase [Bacillota bacterium]HPZ22284.1 MBL fold metallo-hydrolase [Bacillota bacterium]HQD20188.1 MBL fold metallo-hydrolase [Bacillota bacterium]